MTNDEFCRIMREFDGEPMDKVGQLTYIQFTGEELKEFCDHVESQVKKDLIAGVVGQSEQLCQHKYQDIRYGTSRCVICGEEEQSF